MRSSTTASDCWRAGTAFDRYCFSALAEASCCLKRATLVPIELTHHGIAPSRIAIPRRNHCSQAPSTTFATKSAHPSRGNCREGRPVTARKRTLALSSNRSAEEAIVVATGAPRERGRPAWVVLGHFAGVEMVGVDPARVLLCPSHIRASRVA